MHIRFKDMPMVASSSSGCGHTGKLDDPDHMYGPDAAHADALQGLHCNALSRHQGCKHARSQSVHR